MVAGMYVIWVRLRRGRFIAPFTAGAKLCPCGNDSQLLLVYVRPELVTEQ